MTSRWLVGLAACTLILVPVRSDLLAQAAAQPADSTRATAEGTIRELYRLVCFTPGAPTDWAKVRALFLPQAVIVLRTSRTASTVFTLDGFIEDFVRFDALPAVAQNGFTERIVRMRTTEFRDIAHAWVLYEAHVTASPRPPQQGVDSFELIRQDGRWWIAAVTNDIVTEEAPPPAELRP